MAGSLVQSASISGSGSSFGATFGATPTAGNAIVALLGLYQDSSLLLTSVTDNKGNSYTQPDAGGGASKSSTVSNCLAAVSRALNIASSATFTVTITPNEFSTCEATIGEWSGLATASADDSSGNNSGVSSSSDPSVAGNATSQADGVIFAVCSVDSSSTDLQFASPTGYTNIKRQNNANTTFGFSADYKITSATETPNPTWPENNQFQSGWTAALLALKAAGGGGATVTYPELERSRRGSSRGVSIGVG